jgi:hypothetical protein
VANDSSEFSQHIRRAASVSKWKPQPSLSPPQLASRTMLALTDVILQRGECSDFAACVAGGHVRRARVVLSRRLTTAVAAQLRLEHLLEGLLQVGLRVQG